MTRLLEYDRDRQWLIATERIGDRESSTVVARDVPLSVGLAIVAVVDQARVVADWHDAIPSKLIAWHGLDYRELHERLAELGRLVDAI